MMNLTRCPLYFLTLLVLIICGAMLLPWPGQALAEGPVTQEPEANSALKQENEQDSRLDSKPAHQLKNLIPSYGPLTILQEEVSSSTIDLLPAYSGSDNSLNSFSILKEGDTYYLWVGNRVRTGGSNFNSIEQRFESQDGLIWRNRSNTNLTRSGFHSYLLGLRQVIKNGNIYEGWEHYHFEISSGWALATRYITSTDGLNWNIAAQPALVGSYGATVIKDGSVYRMWALPHGDSSYDGTRSLRYRISNGPGGDWGHWQTGGEVVKIDVTKETPLQSRVRQLADGTYQLFYIEGSYIHLATGSDGSNFTTTVPNLLNLAATLPPDFVNILSDFDVVDVEGEDWFYFTFCESLDQGLCQNSRIAVSRPESNLAITKAVTPAQVAPGQPVTYTLTFSNIGFGVAKGVVITDLVPPAVTDLSVTHSGPAITNTGQTPGYVWLVQDLLPGEGGVITLTGQIDPASGQNTNIVNTATITTTMVDANPLNNSATVLSTIQPMADLALTKQVTPPLAIINLPLTYTLTLTNYGPAEATNLLLVDPLPAGLTFISASPACSQGNSGLTCTLASLPKDATATFTIVVTPTQAGPVTNTATIAATLFDSNPANNTASAYTIVNEPTVEPPFSHLYLPVIILGDTSPTFPLHIGEAIPIRPANPQGEIFYTTQIQIPATLPAGGHFYFSSQPDTAAPALVDDELAVLLAGGTEVFSHRVGPEPAIIEVPRLTMEQMAGQTVTVEYRDVFGVTVRATDMWLIWTP